MSKHTPGPWVAAPYEGYGPRTTVRQGCERTGMRIASTFETTSPRNIERNEANARLIAAAPELLQALMAICDEGDARQGYASIEAYDIARTAIAKATGEQA
jgi:hypothetical protein